MRRLIKFLHTMGAIGLIGAIACLLVMFSVLPPRSSLAQYASSREAMAAIVRWVFMPSLACVLISGLIAIAANRGFHDAGWAWIKLASGILVFEGGLVSISGPIDEEATRSAGALSGGFDVAGLATSVTAEQNSLWIILAVATANVVVGIWRPRLMRRVET